MARTITWRINERGTTRGPRRASRNRRFCRRRVAFAFLAPGGFIGVSLFFVLSGYLITSLLEEEIRSSGTIAFGRFYARRSARLMPALSIMLAFATIASFALSPHRDDDMREVIYAALYITNWMRAFKLDQGSFLGHTWSLAIEEQFYLAWPLLLLACRRSRFCSAPALAILLSLASLAWSAWLAHNGATTERTYNGFDTRAEELFVGCALSYFPLQSRIAAFASRFWILPAGALIFIAETADPNSMLLPEGGFGIIAILCAWIVVAVLKKGRLAEIVTSEPLVRLGRVSYGVYLWHFPLFEMLGAWKLVSSPWATIALIPCTIALSIWAAALSFRSVEMPVRRWIAAKL